MTELYNKYYKLVANNTNTGKTLTIQDFQINFSGKIYGDSNLNEMDISIANLGNSDRAFFDEEKYKIDIELYAGYKSLNGLIFKGTQELSNVKKGDGIKGFDKYNSRSKQDHTNWVTTLTCKDGIKHTKGSAFSLSMKGKQKVSSVINEVAKKLGLPKGSINTKGFKKQEFNNGFSASGNAYAFVQNLCRKNGHVAVIEKGILNIRKIGEPLSNQIILLDKSSGLLGSPEKTEKGIKARSQLRPDFFTGGIVEIRSDYVKGQFIINNMYPVGDYRGNDWYIDLEVQRYG